MLKEGGECARRVIGRHGHGCPTALERKSKHQVNKEDRALTAATRKTQKEADARPQDGRTGLCFSRL